jgi:hypothetical protein
LRRGNRSPPPPPQEIDFQLVESQSLFILFKNVLNMLKTRYACYYFSFQNKVFSRNGNTACWAGIQRYYNGSLNRPKYIYIEQYNLDETNKYIELLIGLINEIIPCKIITREKKEYIKYQLLGYYNNDLILLNFIRNLWHNPLYSYNIDYTKIFFETLESSKLKDALEKLTEANIKASKGITMRPGHSNVNPDMKIKSTKELLDSPELSSTSIFLTNKP